MFRSLYTYCRVLVALCNIFALVLSTGVHLHVFLEHRHDAESPGLNDIVVHAHEDSSAPISASVPSSDREHRHHVLATQLVATHVSSIQSSFASFVQLESPVVCSQSTVIEQSGLLICGDSSPPASRPSSNPLLGRAPPSTKETSPLI